MTIPTHKVLLPGQLPNGNTILAIIMKRTYNFAHNQICKRAEKDLPIHTADIPYADPMNSTIKYEADFVAHKLSTDVVLNGYAYTETSTEKTETLCTLQIGERRKDIKVFGDRVAHIENNTVLFSKPDPFERIELRYENAYGGIDIFTDKEIPYPYPRNHMGKGFLLNPSKKTKIQLPNLETPELLLTPQSLLINKMDNWEKQPLPAGFGWYSKGWKPRCDYAGVLPNHKEFEEELFNLYLQSLPKTEHKTMKSARLPNMNFKFFNGASHGLSLSYLTGHEIIKTQNLCNIGRCDFKLPNEQPKVHLTIDQTDYNPQPKLYTIMIRMEDKQVDLTWCAHLNCPDIEWLTSRNNVLVDID